jgi:hypothetical protein
MTKVQQQHRASHACPRSRLLTRHARAKRDDGDDEGLESVRRKGQRRVSVVGEAAGVTSWQEVGSEGGKVRCRP